MLNYFLSLMLAVNLIGCKPDEPIPDPKEEKQNPVIWNSIITTDPASSLNSAAIYYKGSVIMGKKEQKGYTVFAKDAVNGDSLWETTIKSHGAFNPLDGDETFLFEDKIIFSEGLEIFVLDARTGRLLWQDITDGFRGGSCAIDGYIYKSDFVNGTSSTMYRFDINSGNKATLFSIKRGEMEQGGDFSPFLNLPVKWRHPKGDEILVLQNRTHANDRLGPDGKYGYSKMDLLAYNVTADSILWYQYEVDNQSSRSRPAIDGDKVYFFGDKTVFCIHALNGNILWEYKIGSEATDNFVSANILIVHDKLIAKPNNSDMHALNKETGALIWKNTNLVSMPGLLTVKDNMIWFGSYGIWAIDANTGKTIIEGHKGTSGSWIFPIAHHPEKDYIYTSDGGTFWCLDWKKLVK